MSRTIVLDRISALSAEALNTELTRKQFQLCYKYDSTMFPKVNSSEVSGCGQGPYRDRNTVMVSNIRYW